jgi:7-cyano-7-deazaguanosine (preQ0) biosynthesis protein QueE
MPGHDLLTVSEVFGPTWQGEGPSLGRRAGFVRLGRCNLTCRWCDTPYTWDWDHHDPAVELFAVSAADVLTRLDAMAIDFVVVTGGEPLVQQRRLTPLLEGARARGWRVEIETNGTVAPELPLELLDAYNVSPKLASSGVELYRRCVRDALRLFLATRKAVFKFVVCDPADLDEVARLTEECALSPVYVMPEATDAATLVARTRALACDVLARGWNLTTRLQTLVWDDRRGV